MSTSKSVVREVVRRQQPTARPMTSESGYGSAFVDLDTFRVLLRELEHVPPVAALYDALCGLPGAAEEDAALEDPLAEFLANQKGSHAQHRIPAKPVPPPLTSLETFTEYLLSDSNDIFDPVCDELYQDMSLPLSNYWISSSHNTYLSGRQVLDSQSIDVRLFQIGHEKSSKNHTHPSNLYIYVCVFFSQMYVACFKQGGRCVELDCWDGDDGIPEVPIKPTLICICCCLWLFVSLLKGVSWIHNDSASTALSQCS